MSPEKVQDVLLVLLALATIALIWQACERARFERWVRGELGRVGRAGACTQKAHERIVETVRALDLRVPKRRPAATHEVGWGTLLNDADTRALGARETYPAIDLGAIAASRRQ